MQSSDVNTNTVSTNPAPPSKDPIDKTPIPVPAPTPTIKNPITLKFPAQFTKTTYQDEGCGHQNGLEAYTYTLDPTIRVGQLIVSKKSLPMDADQKADFQDAVDVINGDKTVVYSTTPTSSEVRGLPLAATYAECGGAAYYPTATFNVNYPGVDKATAIMSLGGYQSYFDNVDSADMTLWIYMVKGDEIAEASLRFHLSEAFSAAEGNACMTTFEGNTFIDPQCLVDNSAGNTTKLNLYKAKAEQLKNIIQLVD
ncbi:MAG: hypothetical protein ABIM99_00575 [Candidatus Dojkabacteria bacterium]